MQLHHRSGQVAYVHLGDAVALFVEHLGFEKVVEAGGSTLVRGPGSNVEIQLLGTSRSTASQGKKEQSHIGFTSDRPVEERAAMQQWCKQRGWRPNSGSGRNVSCGSICPRCSSTS